LVAKLQSKKNRINGDDLERFAFLGKDKSPDDLIKSIRNLSINEVKSLIHDTADLWPFLDEPKSYNYKILISNHSDQFIEMERGYGLGQKPEDYIESFKNYIQT